MISPKDNHIGKQKTMKNEFLKTQDTASLVSVSYDAQIYRRERGNKGLAILCFKLILNKNVLNVLKHV